MSILDCSPRVIFAVMHRNIFLLGYPIQIFAPPESSFCDERYFVTKIFCDELTMVPSFFWLLLPLAHDSSLLATHSRIYPL